MKTCSRCHQSLPLSAFGKSKSARDGHMYYCRECMKSYNADRRQDAEYWAKQLERGKKSKAVWMTREGNRDRRNAGYRARYAADPQCRIRRAEVYRQRVNFQLGQPGFTDQEWRELKAFYGGVCLACGSTEHLEADHVIPLSKGGPHCIENIQPLCRPCNSRKRDRFIDYRPEALSKCSSREPGGFFMPPASPRWRCPHV